jgi:hypothetical protein
VAVTLLSPMTTVTPQQQIGTSEQAEDTKPSGPTDGAWMVALLLVFAVAVGYFFVNVIQFHLLPH